MAESTDNRYAIFREYQTKPFYRRACTITFDPGSEDKYLLSDVSRFVCDSGFMQVIARVMAAPHSPHRSHRANGIFARVIEDPIPPGTLEHFELAVEAIPASIVTEPERRSI